MYETAASGSVTKQRGAGAVAMTTLGRILYVEDNLENRILIKRVLEAEGYTVIEAANGREGLALAESHHPDLILMDINLPDVDGYECTRRLRSADGLSQIPILALTANVLESDRQRALDVGCDGYIPKPIDVDELPNVIASYLKKRSPSPGEAFQKDEDKPAGAEAAPKPPVTSEAEERPAQNARPPVGGEGGGWAVPPRTLL